jgi:hypothetical protein
MDSAAYKWKKVNRTVPREAADVWDDLVKDEGPWLRSYLETAPSERFQGNRAGVSLGAPAGGR